MTLSSSRLNNVHFLVVVLLWLGLASASGSAEVYVEREPALQIPGSGIESVIVGKEKNYGNSPKELERMRRDLEEIIKAKSKMEKRDEKTYPSGFSYKLTFKLKPVDWKREVS